MVHQWFHEEPHPLNISIAQKVVYIGILKNGFNFFFNIDAIEEPILAPQKNFKGTDL